MSWFWSQGSAWTCMSSREEAGHRGEEGGDMTVVPREVSLADSENLKRGSGRGSGDVSRTWNDSGSGSGVGSLIGSGVGSLIGSGVGSLIGSGVGSLIGSGVGSLIGSGVGSLTGSGRVGVFVSLLAAGFLAGTSDFEADLGASGLADFVMGGRVRGESDGFLDAEAAGVVVLDVCDAGGLPPEGVVEVSLEAAGLAVVVEEVFGVVVLGVAGELLAVLEVGVRVGPVAGRDDAGVP
ncbi:hypothetical protein F7725_003905, partial [Dissostichus mawsoni]